MKKISLMTIVIFLGAIPFLYAQSTEPAGQWQFRLRGIAVTPDESADIEAIGGDADISTAVVPEFDITYYLNSNWSLELILATTNHDVSAINTAVGNIDLGDVWLLPPTLTFQYHFTSMGNFRPYLGTGLNYTIFYSADEGPVADNVDYDNAVGFAFQAGIDYMLNDRWFINADVKKILLNTDATVNATSALGATVGADVDIDPWVFGVGFGIKF